MAAAAAALLAASGTVLGVHFAAAGKTASAEAARVYQVPAEKAPDFALTDQSGHLLTLNSLRGKAVLIYFMDPRCTDVCPLVAQEFVQADSELGASAARVEFVGIDVNPRFRARRWLDVFDAEHGLNKLPNWHFVTGTLAQLRRVWEDYNISVQLTRSGDVVHTTLFEFVGPDGRIHAIASPTATLRRNGTGYLPAAQLGQWSASVASQLRRMLPSTAGGTS